mmetsp:Transcript_18879/g.38293  ORF Transcript_18879/g.38293 Transcript_18879/m.38293 type:complete len:241 (+) Transcript_18879:1048-1770(+)
MPGRSRAVPDRLHEAVPRLLLPGGRVQEGRGRLHLDHGSGGRRPERLGTQDRYGRGGIGPRGPSGRGPGGRGGFSPRDQGTGDLLLRDPDGRVRRVGGIGEAAQERGADVHRAVRDSGRHLSDAWPADDEERQDHEEDPEEDRERRDGDAGGHDDAGGSGGGGPAGGEDGEAEVERKEGGVGRGCGERVAGCVCVVGKLPPSCGAPARNSLCPILLFVTEKDWKETLVLRNCRCFPTMGF